jgi:hypothetical protein
MMGTGNGGNENKVEPIVLLLVALVIFFTVILIGVARMMSSDGQTFQIIAGLVTGFSGALLMRVKPKNTAEDNVPMPNDTTRVTTHKTQDTIATVDPPPTGKGSK